MHVSPEDFAIRYRELSESELQKLAQSYEDLTDPAQQALREEFSRRSLDAPLIDDLSPDQEVSVTLVTVRRYRDLSEAIVARSFLESAGIPVFLCDENLVRLDWQISNFIGGIRLQVDQGDEAEATELLAEPKFDSIVYAQDAEFVQPHCPVCNSTNISFQGSSRGAALASLYLLSVPLPVGAETWLCNACGSRWEDSANDGHGSDHQAQDLPQ